MKGVFRSLNNRNYRIWAAGALVSNVGTWMQRTAQDWLVLTGLTHRNATAVGIVMALQYGPQLLFLPWTGFAADYFDRRKLLLLTQAAKGVLALMLGLLTVFGAVMLWHVYVLAFLLGTVSAFDQPARQTFVYDLVGDTDLSNAIALNSTSFNAARLIGPAVAGVIVAAVGPGWAFLFNAASFVAVVWSLTLLRRDELHARVRIARTRGHFGEGLRYVWEHRELRVTAIMLFLIGTFGLNFPIYISTMSASVFHVGADRFGLLMSMMAVGSLIGALLAARRERPTFGLLLAGAAVFGGGLLMAALMPDYVLFGLALIVVGVAALTFTNSSNSLMQLSAEPSMRGRVIAIRASIALGGTPLGAPIVGWVADRLGPRCGVGVGAAAGFAAAIVAAHYLWKHRRPQLGVGVKGDL
ncbi:MFS transporter [Trinickia symbiotica]|uniref:MFS transporter n=1 Tax=Trinickia symbiotica TaxID=863227 RepID=A0A2T3Y1S8_9BURK|nr:MFS transporter [Trinickia symbiotica]PTB22708.1 MFS transporter [Trinickia symbiotica]